MFEILKEPIDGLCVYELETAGQHIRKLQETNADFLDGTVLGSLLLRLELVIYKTMITKMKDQFHREIFDGGTTL